MLVAAVNKCNQDKTYKNFVHSFLAIGPIGVLPVGAEVVGHIGVQLLGGFGLGAPPSTPAPTTTSSSTPTTSYRLSSPVVAALDIFGGLDSSSLLWLSFGITGTY